MSDAAPDQNVVRRLKIINIFIHRRRAFLHRSWICARRSDKAIGGPKLNGGSNPNSSWLPSPMSPKYQRSNQFNAPSSKPKQHIKKFKISTAISFWGNVKCHMQFLLLELCSKLSLLSLGSIILFTPCFLYSQRRIKKKKWLKLFFTSITFWLEKIKVRLSWPQFVKSQKSWCPYVTNVTFKCFFQ